ncbi:phage tail protein [Paludibacteraceae bacterium OttesenSCG-928-F17]|nr:phage tail protein [Paludibacteraceae bacterium OttesenSCG-928-F17]
MLAQLGTYVFEGLQAPSSINTGSSAKYGQIPLINGKDVLQKIGDELDEFNLSLSLSVEFCQPAELIANLKASQKSGEILPFIMGDGTIVGKYVITSVDISFQKLSTTGVLEAAQVNISLLEYAGKEKTQPTGLALRSNNPVAQSPALPKNSSAESISKDLSKAKQNVSRIKQIGASAKGSITTYKRRVREVRQLANNTKQLYSTAKTKVTATKKIISRAKDLPTSLDEAIKYAENLAKMGNVTDFAVVNNNINQLSDSADKVTKSASPVTSFGATKEGGN